MTAIGKLGSKLNSVKCEGRRLPWSSPFDAGGAMRHIADAGLDEIYFCAMRQAAERAKITGGKGIVVSLMVDLSSDS